MAVSKLGPKCEKGIEELFASSKSCLLGWSKFCSIVQRSELPLCVCADIGKMPILECCTFFWDLSFKELNSAQIAALQAVACMLYLLNINRDKSRAARGTLVKRSFQLAPSLDPKLVHFYTQHLLDCLELDKRANIHQALIIANYLSTECPMSKAVAVCLLWNTIGNSCQTNISDHQHRNFSELNEMLKGVAVDSMTVANYRSLVRAIGMLLHFMLCNLWFEDFMANNYSSSYFRMSPHQASVLRNCLQGHLNFFREKRENGVVRVIRKLLSALASIRRHGAQFCLSCRGRPYVPYAIKTCELSTLGFNGK